MLTKLSNIHAEITIFHGCEQLPPQTEYAKYEEAVLTKINNSLDLEIPILPDDIDILHPLPSKNEKTSIMIKFIRRKTKHSVFHQKRKLKGTGYSITESLTKRRLQLLQAARDAFGFKKVWTQDGIIHAWYNNTRRVIRHLDDIDALFRPNRSYSSVATG